MGSLWARLMDVISDYRESIEGPHANEGELERAFERVENDLRHRRWLKDEESNPARVKGLGREAIVRAERVRSADGLFDELQGEIVDRNREGSLASIERIRRWLYDIV